MNITMGSNMNAHQCFCDKERPPPNVYWEAGKVNVRYSVRHPADVYLREHTSCKE